VTLSGLDRASHSKSGKCQVENKDTVVYEGRRAAPLDAYVHELISL
jgi:hypothetical protein